MIAPVFYDFLLFGEKVCPGCGQTLPRCTDFFPPSKTHGVGHVCRECKNRRARESYRRDPEKKLAAQRTRHEREKVAS